MDPFQTKSFSLDQNTFGSWSWTGPVWRAGRRDRRGKAGGWVKKAGGAGRAGRADGLKQFSLFCRLKGHLFLCSVFVHSGCSCYPRLDALVRGESDHTVPIAIQEFRRTSHVQCDCMDKSCHFCNQVSAATSQNPPATLVTIQVI